MAALKDRTIARNAQSSLQNPLNDLAYGLGHINMSARVQALAQAQAGHRNLSPR